jgi:hypothetical protein
MLQQPQRSTSFMLCETTEGGVLARELLVLLGVLALVELRLMLGDAFPKIKDPVKARDTLVPLTASLRLSANLAGATMELTK